MKTLSLVLALLTFASTSAFARSGEQEKEAHALMTALFQKLPQVKAVEDGRAVENFPGYLADLLVDYGIVAAEEGDPVIIHSVRSGCDDALRNCELAIYSEMYTKSKDGFSEMMARNLTLIELKVIPTKDGFALRSPDIQVTYKSLYDASNLDNGAGLEAQEQKEKLRQRKVR
jgi:hypothetical protein